MFSREPLHMDTAETLDVVKRFCRERWKIGTDDKRESSESVLSVRLDDDEDNNDNLKTLQAECVTKMKQKIQFFNYDRKSIEVFKNKELDLFLFYF